jgi:hypothetical protein
MKKMMIILIVALGSSKSSADNAFEDLQSTPHEDVYECIDNTCFLEIAADDESVTINRTVEEQGNQDEVVVTQQDQLDEYDQNVSDNVQPPKISAAQQMLARVFGELLVRYINMKELARVYFHEVKDVLAKWYHQYL